MAKRPPIEARFMAKVNQTETCWLWTAHKSRNGYGRFSVRGRHQGAHRVAYELFVGPIPDGMHIDHLCRVKHCVNPEHLEAVTPSENTRGGFVGRIPYQALMDACRKGHPYDEENTITTPTGRECRTCKRERARASYERHRELVCDRSRQWHLNNKERSLELRREAQRRYRARQKEQAA